PPMLSARFLRPQHGRRSRFFQTTERFFDGMLHLYERTLQVTLRYRLAVLMLSFVILGATMSLFLRIPKGFLPGEDTSQIFAITEATQGASHLDMARDHQILADKLRQDPAIRSFFVGIGGTSGSVSAGGPNFGRMFFHLKPRSERKEHVDEVIARF